MPDWLQNAPGALEAATALVVDGNPQPARDWLEETQDFLPLPPGVWRRSTDPDTLEADADDGMRSYSRAPELSMRNDK